MNVVIVDADVSYPATSGKRLRTLNLMLRLADRHHITYLGRLTGPDSDAPEARRFLREHGIEPIFVHAPLPRKSGLGFVTRLAANLLSPMPYSVQSHQSGMITDAVRKLARDRQVDVWQVEWPLYLPMVEKQRHAPRVVIAHNVETLIWRRYYETAKGPLRRAFLKQQWRKYAVCERHVLREAERVVAVSSADAQIIRAQFGRRDVDVVDNGVDAAYFADVPGPVEPNHILFLGALDWRPNQDGVLQLLEHVFPAVRLLVPEARLSIVGRNPPEWLRQRVASFAHVELHADVPDVRPFLGRASVMAVPLRIGGGSRLKILEALAAGLPVVASRVGAEGLHLSPGLHYQCADEDRMAASLVDVLRDPAAARAQAARGQELVRARYDWDVLARTLENVWESARAGTLEPAGVR